MIELRSAREIGTSFDNIPDRLRRADQWVCWKYQHDQAGNMQRLRKVPIDPGTRRFAKVTDSSTWSSIDDAMAVQRSSSDELAGIGFVFTADDPFIGIDLDHCRDNGTGQFTDWAQQIIERLGTYTEVSPSGTGVKAIATLDSGFQSRRRSDPGIEVYGSARFFTITGASIDGNLETREGSRGLSWIQDRYFPEPVAAPAKHFPVQDQPIAPDRLVLHKAMSAKNGAKFRDLWSGNLNHNNGNRSEADLSFCRLLAFWCGPCLTQIDRLFRRSNLFRSKWDERHFSSGATYGIETIRRAITAQGKTFYRWPNLNSHCTGANA